MVDYFKDLQFIVILVNAHAEIQARIPASTWSKPAMHFKGCMFFSQRWSLCLQWKCDHSEKRKKREKGKQSRTLKCAMKYLSTPFVDNFISPPLHKVAKLRTSGQNYATELSNYLYKVLTVSFQDFGNAHHS